MAEVWFGMSDDGLHFTMDEAPVIFPGPDLADLDGCEDPTVMQHDGLLLLWHTGYNERERVGRLLYARGPDSKRLATVGVAIEPWPSRFADPKEASVVQIGDRWRLFFEFACDGASLVGQVDAGRPDDPWSDPADLLIAPRSDSWDNWHLRPGPVIGAGTDRPVLIYNGADRAARWRIGWAASSRDFSQIVARSDAPLHSPERERLGQDADIAFASSAVETEDGGRELFLRLRSAFAARIRDVRMGIREPHPFRSTPTRPHVTPPGRRATGVRRYRVTGSES
ncbi:hypothetical protein FPZ54_13485 [Sphingomonas suaedae]|uniref:Uncharacterized protein n=1 Tax=Sphingomonas suaedae TaxID=2599297 RepID=A0A518RHH3_9SPHN|nr:hypothetical protein [Sphingomonas suaedae]QDX26917.1 hypothetical protein FPZ54_13485 [Sphingomonas suaedae]